MSKNMYATILLMSVLICYGYSDTCDSNVDNCEQIIPTIRIIDNLQNKFNSYKIEREKIKLEQEASVQDLLSKLVTINKESQAQKMDLIELQDIVDKLNNSKGQPGPQGGEGDQGEKGEQGIKGETGETGVSGATGENGTKGDTGPTGPKGDRGLTGPKGDIGPTGPTCCPDVDPCLISPCQNGGICVRTDDDYKCICPPWLTGSMCESAQSPSCQLVAECASGVGDIYDVQEETPDTVLVSGRAGIARCNVTGGSGQGIQRPSGSTFSSTIITDAGELWTISTYSGGKSIYRMNANKEWQRVLEGQFTDSAKLEFNNNRTLMILDTTEKRIKSVKMASEPSIEAMLDLTSATTWNTIADFAVLPSGEVVVSDSKANCVHIVGHDGRLVATLGICGSPGWVLGKFYTQLGVCVDIFANILVADQFNYRIAVFNSTGTAITTLCQLNGPRNVLVTSSGYLVVGDNNGLVKIFKYYN